MYNNYTLKYVKRPGKRRTFHEKHLRHHGHISHGISKNCLFVMKCLVKIFGEMQCLVEEIALGDDYKILE